MNQGLQSEHLALNTLRCSTHLMNNVVVTRAEDYLSVGHKLQGKMWVVFVRMLTMTAVLWPGNGGELWEGPR